MDPVFLFVMVLFLVVVLMIGWVIYRWLDLRKRRELRTMEHTAPRPSEEGHEAVVRKPTMRYQLENGVGYLLYDLRSDEAYKILRGYSAWDFEAVIVSRKPPSKILARHQTGADMYIWLTRSKTGGSDVPVDGRSMGEIRKVKPTNLGGTLQEIKDFIKAHDRPFIFVDGLEEMILDNEFGRVLKFADNLEESVALSKSKMLLALNPKSLTRSQKSSLTKRFRVIRKDTGKN